MANDVIRLGTRGSVLARWQTDHIQSLLEKAWPEKQFETVVFSTKGDEILDTPLPLIGGKGLFTAELEAALHDGRIDFAVHSLKDLPTELPEGLTVGAIPKRAGVYDVLVSRNNYTLETIPEHGVVGTSSTRRSSQLKAQRPDISTADIRGNISTRINKGLDPDGVYDAIVLAYAGLERLEQLDVISEVLQPDMMLPAPGQGALGVQCRAQEESLSLLTVINHEETNKATTAERAFLAGLGGGCSVPIAAYAQIIGNQVTLTGRVISLDGKSMIEVQGNHRDPNILGQDLAQQALVQGAKTLLEIN